MGNDGNGCGQAWEERRARAASVDAPIGRLAFPGACLKAATGPHAMQRKPGGSNQWRFMSREGHDLAARLGQCLGSPAASGLQKKEAPDDPSYHCGFGAK